MKRLSIGLVFLLISNSFCLQLPTIFQSDNTENIIDYYFLMHTKQASSHLVETGVIELPNGQYLKICKKYPGIYSLFLNSIVYILDVCFRANNKYKYRHVVAPLGYSYSLNQYYMEYAHGNDGYTIIIYDEYSPRGRDEDPAEFNIFIRNMSAAGISFIDLGSPFGGTKNVMFNPHHKEGIEDIDNTDWKMIDFESNSIRIDKRKLLNYVNNINPSLLSPIEYTILQLSTYIYKSTLAHTLDPISVTRIFHIYFDFLIKNVLKKYEKQYIVKKMENDLLVKTQFAPKCTRRFTINKLLIINNCLSGFDLHKIKGLNIKSIKKIQECL